MKRLALLTCILASSVAAASQSPLCIKINTARIGSAPATAIIGTTIGAIQANFARVIEGNFVATNPSRIIESLSPKELADLGALYGKATGGATSGLLEILAKKLDAADLVRVASAFGQVPTAEIVSSYAPTKVAEAFFAAKPLPAAAPSPAVAAALGGLQPAISVYYTPYEIYLDFRTAPYGSLGITDALFETAAYMSTYVAGAFGIGTYIGTEINQAIENYYPALEMDIGGTVDSMALDIEDAGSEVLKGDYQSAMDSLFGTPLPENASDDGDFDVTLDMSFYFTGIVC